MYCGGKRGYGDHSNMGVEIHIARDTQHGVLTLCGQMDAMAVYPSELRTYSDEALCQSCKHIYLLD